MFLPSLVGIDPLIAVARALAGFNRDPLGSAIEVLMALMNVADGDPDVEVEDPAGETIPVVDNPDVPPEQDDGDPDLEETDCEDSFVLSSNALAYGNGYPSCPISDIDMGVEDDPRASIRKRVASTTAGSPRSTSRSSPPLRLP